MTAGSAVCIACSGFLAFVAIIGFFSGIAEDVTAGTGDIGRYVAFVFIVGDRESGCIPR